QRQMGQNRAVVYGGVQRGLEMKRVDEIRVRDDGDEEIVCGIILFCGKLQWAEGSKCCANNLINMAFNIPGPHGELKRLRGVDDPEAWLKWAPFRLSNA